MQNEVAARQDDTTIPQVGDLATITYHSDRVPARVVAVSHSGHQVTLAMLDYTVISGSAHDGSAKYRIFAHPRDDAPRDVATRRSPRSKAVRYRLRGWDVGGIVRFGHADVYRDPSF